jgi:hypothetical protein
MNPYDLFGSRSEYALNNKFYQIENEKQSLICQQLLLYKRFVRMYRYRTSLRPALSRYLEGAFLESADLEKYLMAKAKTSHNSIELCVDQHSVDCNT